MMARSVVSAALQTCDHLPFGSTIQWYQRQRPKLYSGREVVTLCVPNKVAPEMGAQREHHGYFLRVRLLASKVPDAPSISE